jgi:hypothetical protein
LIEVLVLVGGVSACTGTPTDSIFGREPISDTSLDEVVMAYLGEESIDGRDALV